MSENLRTKQAEHCVNKPQNKRKPTFYSTQNC